MDSDADNYCSASEISRDIIDLEVAPVDMGIPVLWHSVALYYQISQQYFGTESLLSSATQCSSPGISQLHIIKYHPGIDREFYDTLLRCQLVDFNAIIPAFV